MGVSELSLQFLCGGAPSSGLFASTSNLIVPFKGHLKSKKKRGTLYLKEQSYTCIPTSCFKAENGIAVNSSYCGNKLSNGSRHLKCQCQQAEGITGITSEDSGNGAWLANDQVLNEVIEQEVIGHEELYPSNIENGSLVSDDDKSVLSASAKQISQKKKASSVEDEAWHLLQESVVYYCGSPVGTIAAKDPSDGNVLNYDQVFIRDFVPSGIAFLLKGEYEIVRNFILHTLQLQVLCLSLL